MNKNLTDKLAKLDEALASLSEGDQSEMLEALAGRVAERTGSRMSAQQHALVERRLTQPRVYASDAEVADLLQRYSAR